MRPRRALSLAIMLGVASVSASKECVVCGLIMALVEEHRHLSRILCPDPHEPACADATGRLLDLVRGGANPDKVCALLGVCMFENRPSMVREFMTEPTSLGL